QLVATGAVDPQDLCANASLSSFFASIAPMFPCRNFFPGLGGPPGVQPSGYVWSYVVPTSQVDLEKTSYIYITSAATGGVLGYWTEQWQTWGGRTASVIVHRTDQNGPRVSEYEGLSIFDEMANLTTVPPGPPPADVFGPSAGAFPSGSTSPTATGFIGQFGFTTFVPLVMHNYHGWNTLLWLHNQQWANQIAVTYYDLAGNPVLEDTGYTPAEGFVPPLSGAGLPDGFVGSAWISTTNINGVV